MNKTFFSSPPHFAAALALFVVLIMISPAAYAWQLNAEVQKANPELSMKAPLELALWPKGHLKSGENKERRLPDRGDGVIRLTDVSEPTMRVFPARDDQGQLMQGDATPAVVICPGGGYAILSIKQEGWDVAEWFSRNGITAIVLKYRVPKNRTAAYEDVQRALRMVRHRAKLWNINPEKVGVLGFSAGGHLAARLNAGFNQRASAVLDGVDEMSCRPDFTVLVYPAYLKGRDPKGSPEGHSVAKEVLAVQKTPPTLIIHTEDDAKFVEGSRRYARMLRQSGVQLSFEIYKKGGHGYGLGHGKTLVSQWPIRCRQWLQELDVISVSAR